MTREEIEAMAKITPKNTSGRLLCMSSQYTIESFQGQFEFLPLRAGIMFGAVPEYPSDSDFHLAASAVKNEGTDDVAAHWQLEAVRFRRLNPGAKLDATALKSIANAVAARIFRVIREEM